MEIRIYHPSDSQRTGILLISFPRTQQQTDNPIHHFILTGKAHAHPLFCNLFGRKRCGIRQTTKTIKIRSRQIISCPVFIITGITNCGNSRILISISTATYYICYCIRFFLAISLKVQNFFKQRNQVTKVYLLSGIFLCHLHFQHLVCLFQATQKRRNRFSNLEIHGTVFNL